MVSSDLIAYNNTPVLAGGLAALDLNGSLTGSSGFFGNNTAVAAVGNVSSGSNQLTALSTVAGVTVGQFVSVTDIPAGATVLSINSATATITLNSVLAGATVTVNGIVLTAVSGTPSVDQFKVGVSNTADAASLATAINSDASLSVVIAAVAVSGVVTLTTIVSGDSSSYPFFHRVIQVNSHSGPVLSASSITISATATGNATATAINFYVGAQVAYRAVWGIIDANNNEILGVPSNRFIIANTVSYHDG